MYYGVQHSGRYTVANASSRRRVRARRDSGEHMSGGQSQTSQRSLTNIAVIIPAFNEMGSIEKTVGGIRSLTGMLSERGLHLTIIVIDDGSEDATGRLALSAGADRVIRHRVNTGLGAAVRTGIRAGLDHGCDILVKFDADLQHDPHDIIAVIEPLLKNDADIVYGNRFNRLEYRMPLIRRAGNMVFTWLMRRLTGWPILELPARHICCQQRIFGGCLLAGRLQLYAATTDQCLFKQNAIRSGRRFISPANLWHLIHLPSLSV